MFSARQKCKSEEIILNTFSWSGVSLTPDLAGREESGVIRVGMWLKHPADSPCFSGSPSYWESFSSEYPPELQSRAGRCITSREITTPSSVVSEYLQSRYQHGLCLPWLQLCGLPPPHEGWKLRGRMWKKYFACKAYFLYGCYWKKKNQTSIKTMLWGICSFGFVVVKGSPGLTHIWGQSK